MVTRRKVRRSSDCWWLVSNAYGGVHRAWGSTAAEAKRYVREAIIEFYLAEGNSRAGADRHVIAYDITVIAGPASHEEVVEAYENWENDAAVAGALALKTGWKQAARALGVV